MSASLTTNNRQPTTMPQRRQPITHAEVEEVRRTGVLPLMTDPVKTGRTPYCENCAHWEKTSDPHMGICHNPASLGHNPMARFATDWLGEEVRRHRTGGLHTCPAHQGYEVLAGGRAGENLPTP